MSGRDAHVKNVWSKPELLVFVRGTQEEAILSNCKAVGSASGADTSNSSCSWTVCLSTCATVGVS